MISFQFTDSVSNIDAKNDCTDLLTVLTNSTGTILLVVVSNDTYAQIVFAQDMQPILEQFESEMLQYGSTFYLDHEKLKPSFQAFPLIRRYRQGIITEEGLIEASKRIWENYYSLVRERDELSKEYDNQSVLEMILLALWLARMTLTQKQVSSRNKPIILGSLCQFLMEIRNLPDYEVWKEQCNSVLKRLLIESYPELEQHLN